MSDTCCTAEQLAAIGITSDAVLAAFCWGFGAVITFWFLGLLAGVAVDAIRKL